MKSALLDASKIKIILRASGHEAYLAPCIRSAGQDGIVELAPPIPYIDALAEMLAADGLILLQASNCNYQMSAKAYEYIRAGWPVFGVTDYVGDTAKLLGKFSNNVLADIASADDIEKKFQCFIECLSKKPSASLPSPSLEEFFRQIKARELAKILDAIVA